MGAQRRGDAFGIAAGGDDGVTGGERGSGDVDAQTAPGAGDEPDLLVGHEDLPGLESTDRGRSADASGHLAPDDGRDVRGDVRPEPPTTSSSTPPA
jgi:hypothetical protein